MSAPAIPPCRYAVPAELIHDLRTPLGQIIGYSEMLAEQAREGGHDALVPDLLKVGAAGWRLLHLLDANFAAEPGDPGGPVHRSRVTTRAMAPRAARKVL